MCVRALILCVLDREASETLEVFESVQVADRLRRPVNATFALRSASGGASLMLLGKSPPEPQTGVCLHAPGALGLSGGDRSSSFLVEGPNRRSAMVGGTALSD